MLSQLNSIIRSTPLRCVGFAMMTGFLPGCRVNAPQTTLPADYYWITDRADPKSTRQKVYILDSGDSIRVINPANDQRYTLARNTDQRWSFRHTKLDVDVFTIPFKVRRTENGVPPQYDTDFNTAFYVGRRINNYTYQWKSITPTYAVHQLRGRGFGYGLFFGVGSTNVSNDVTRTPINISYQGVVLHAGLATIYDAGPFNFGLAVGLDHLIDPNRQYWIYQYKPWFGVLFGLNLN